MIFTTEEYSSYLLSAKINPEGVLEELEEKIAAAPPMDPENKFKSVMSVGAIVGECLIQNIEGAKWEKLTPGKDMGDISVHVPTEKGNIRVKPVKRAALFFDEGSEWSLIGLYHYISHFNTAVKTGKYQSPSGEFELKVYEIPKDLNNITDEELQRAREFFDDDDLTKEGLVNIIHNVKERDM